MAFVTSDQIRDISVKNVEMFLNNKIPLSQGLAKQASAMELNSEQIQRAVEATNSIAYLKILEMSPDRTMEFPLCKYAEVMRMVSVPEDVDTLYKSASIYTIPVSNTPLIKEASNNTVFELHENDERNYFIKMAAENDAQLETLKDRSITILPELLKSASTVKSDVDGLVKLAQVVSGDDFRKISALVYGEVKEYLPSVYMFKEAQLKDVKIISALFKEAQELCFEIKAKQELSNRSALVKQAFLGAIAGGVGSAIGKTLGSIASAPFRALGAGAGKLASGTATNIKNTATQTASSVKSTAGNFMNKMQGKPMVAKAPALSTAAKFGLGGAAAMAVSAGTDSLMYRPGVHADTGTSKDAWTALQRQS